MQLVVSTHVPEQESTSLATMKITAFHMIPELALGQEAGKHDDSNVRSISQNIPQSIANVELNNVIGPVPSFLRCS